MKKKFTKMLALYLSLAILLPTILIPGLFALANGGAYTTHLMDVYRSSANVPSYGVTNVRYDATLSGIEGATVKYGWSDAATMNNSTGYFYASLNSEATDGTLIDGIPFKADKYVDANGNILGTISGGVMTDNDGNPRGTYSANGSFTYDGTGYSAYSNAYLVKPTDAVMFYVKLPSGAPSTELLFQIATAGMAVHDDGNGNKTVYPAVDANQWLILAKSKPVYLLQKGYEEWVATTTVQSQLGGSNANMVLPAGFEGWVRIPVSTLSQKPERSFYGYRFNFYQKQLGGKYTEGGVQIGSFMFVEEGSENFLKAKVDEASANPRTAELTSDRPHSEVTMLEAAGATSGTAVANETHFANGYTYKLSSASSKLTFKASPEKLYSDGGLMLYYKQPLDAEGKLAVSVGTAALKAGSEVYTISRGESAWTKSDATAAAEISLKKGFEGYIYIPAASLSSGAVGKAVSEITLSGVTANATVGSVLVVEEFERNAIEVRFKGAKEYINLYESAYYNATTIETNDTVTSTDTNKDYYDVSDKVNDPAFSVGVDNGYYYEVTTGTAPEGTTAPEVSAKLPTYTSHLAYTLGTDFRFRAAKKPGSTSFYVNEWIKTSRLTDSATPFASQVINLKVVPSTMTHEYVTDGVFTHTDTKDNCFYAPISFAIAFSVTDSSALIIHIQNTGSYPTEAHIFLGNAYPLRKNTVYHTLTDGTAEWKEHTVKDAPSDNRGHIEIPANFSGYIKLPISGFKSNAGATISNLNQIFYYPIYLGGKYGEINISHFMTVDEGGKDYLTFMDGETEKSFLITADTSYTALVPDEGATNPKSTSADNKKPFAVKRNQNIVTPIGTTWGIDISVNTTSFPSGEYFNTTPSIGINDASDPNTRKFATFYTDNAGKLNGDESVLMYIDHSDSEKSIMAAFGFVGGWAVTRAGRPYYMLAENSAVWMEGSAVAYNPNETAYGFIEIPAGFKGWLRIPSTSCVNGSTEVKDLADDKNNQTQINVFANAIGGDYGTLKIGGVRILNENDNRLNITEGGSKKPLMKGLDLTVKKPIYNVIIDNFLGDKNFTTTAPWGEIYSTITFKSGAVINMGDALMFYASQNGTAASAFAVGLNNTEWSMLSGADYSLYDSKTQYWNSASAGDDGRITLPAGFSGWVRIPLSSFSDKDKAPATAAITANSFNFIPYTLGGAWGSLKLGTLMVTDNGTEDVTTMRVDIGAEKPLTTVKAYTGNTLQLSSLFPAGINARSMSVKEHDHALLSGTVTFTVSEIDTPVECDLISAIEVELSEAASIKSGDALLFYAELAGSKENALIFGDALLVKKGQTYYILNKGNEAVWEKKTASEDGILPLPAGFKGYVRIPAESFSVMPESFEKFVFGFTGIGGDYKQPSFGTFMVTDNGGYNYHNIYLNGNSAVQSLIIADKLEGYLLQGAASHRDDSANALKVTPLGNTLTANVQGGYAYKAEPTGAPISLVGSAFSPRLTFEVESIYKSEMENAGGLMFYVSLPEGKSNRLFLQAQGENYARLSQGYPFYILPEGDGYWTKRVANSYNELSLPEGFKGWVRLAAKDLVTSANVPLAGALSQINLSWRHIGGEWGNPEFGSFIMLTRYADSGELILRGQDALNIYGSNMPTVYDRDDIGIWETITAPFDGYKDGDTYGAGTSTNDTAGLTVEDDEWRRAEAEREAATVYGYEVISDIPESADSVTGEGADKTGVYTNPFGSRGLVFTSTEEVNLHGDQWPRHTFSHPFTLKDSAGIMLYVNLPENPEKETNQLFFQLYSTSGKTVTIKYKKVVATLADGTENWKNVLIDTQSINLPSGFEGYVYIPIEALETYMNSAKVNRVLNNSDDVYRMVLGFGHFGGSNEDGTLKEEGKAYLGGMWLNKNGVLSHDGAYVDGATEVRNVFTGEVVSADDVRYDPFEAPDAVGDIFETLPEATDDLHMIMVEETTGHSASLVWDEYEGADSYRIDLYQTTAIGSTGSFDQVYYTYLGTYYSDDNSVTINGLSPNGYYTVYIIPEKNGNGIAIYQPLSVYTESKIIGDMLGYKSDPYKYAWIEYDEDIDNEIGDSEKEPSSTKKKKVIKRRKKQNGLAPWLLAVIIAGGVVVAAGATLLIIILIKRKKQKTELNSRVKEDANI